MIAVLFYYPVTEGLEQEFEQALSNRPRLVEHQEGFVSFEVLRPTEEESRYILLSKWTSHQTYQSYLSSRAHEQVHRNDHSRFLAGPPEKRIFEIIT